MWWGARQVENKILSTSSWRVYSLTKSTEMVPQPCVAVHPLGPCFPSWGYSSVSSMSSEESNSSSGSRFPMKLHELLSWAETTGEPSVVWVTNKAFIVKDQERFSNVVLPAFFNTRNWKSFTRQLNTYKFKKVQQGPLKGAYGHPYFVRGNLVSCRLMVTYQSTEDVPPSSFYKEIDDYNVMSWSEVFEWQRMLRSQMIQQTLGVRTVPLVTNAPAALPPVALAAALERLAQPSESSFLSTSASTNMESGSLHAGAPPITPESPQPQTGSSLRRSSDHSIEFEGRTFFPVFDDNGRVDEMTDDDAILTSMDTLWDNLPSSDMRPGSAQP
eukprot:Nitzschia sp. Nitz4//scaffold262_size27079//6148//7251//NITZ4_008218-RA/size27079-exonerate_est2genome-gene-0.12-mRNA-1//-1//CDS//3329544745//5290//frame0